MHRLVMIAAAAFVSGLVGAAALLQTPPAQAAGESIEYEDRDWSFEGIFGTFDNASVQRGYYIYREICAGCHAMDLMTYRYLEDVGLPAETVKAIASQDEKMVVNDIGEDVRTPRLPADPFPNPYANEQEARAANGGAYPPDLSLMAKARASGPEYLYALLTGYAEPPANMDMNEGMYYNIAYPGHQIAMAPPLLEGIVDYPDGTAATVEQMAHDTVSFLMFSAEPHLEDRKRTGLKVVAFLLILTVLLYFVKKKVWADVEH